MLPGTSKAFSAIAKVSRPSLVMGLKASHVAYIGPASSFLNFVQTVEKLAPNAKRWLYGAGAFILMRFAIQAHSETKEST